MLMKPAYICALVVGAMHIKVKPISEETDTPRTARPCVVSDTCPTCACVCGDKHAQCQGGSRIGATAQGPLAHHRRPCARRQTRLASRARLLTLRPSSHTCMWETSTRNIKAVVERTRRGHRQAAPPHCHAPFVPRHSSSPCARSVAATGTTSKYCTCAIYFAPRPRRRPSHPNLM